MGPEPSRIVGRHLIPSFTSHLIASATLSIMDDGLRDAADPYSWLGRRLSPASMASIPILLRRQTETLVQPKLRRRSNDRRPVAF